MPPISAVVGAMRVAAKARPLHCHHMCGEEGCQRQYSNLGLFISWYLIYHDSLSQKWESTLIFFNFIPKNRQAKLPQLQLFSSILDAFLQHSLLLTYNGPPGGLFKELGFLERTYFGGLHCGFWQSEQRGAPILSPPPSCLRYREEPVMKDSYY